MTTFIEAMLWALLQISLGCATSLTVVYALRGRRPQLATGILSGTCIACLLILFSTAWPIQYWSLTGLLSQSVDSRNDTASADVGGANLPGSLGVAEGRPGSDLGHSRDQSRNDSAWQLSQGLDWLQLQLQTLQSGIEWASQSPRVSNNQRTIVVPTAVAIVLALMLWWIGWYRFHRSLQGCAPLTDTLILDTVQQLSREFGIRRFPKVYLSPITSVGATLGLRSPIILLNQNCHDWSFSQKRAVIAHELAHIARRDFAWLVISCQAKILLWFHPLMHLVVRRLRLEQELAADQIAASSIGSRAYGRALAELTLALQGTQRTANPVLEASQICVIRRIVMLKQGRLKPTELQPRKTLAAMLLAIVMSIPISGLRGQTSAGNAGVSSTAATVESGTASGSSLVEEDQSSQPFKLDGQMVYRQARMDASHIGRVNSWYGQQFLQSVAIGGLLPAEVTLHGTAGLQLAWADAKKQRCTMTLGSTIRSTDNTLPATVSRSLNALYFGPVVERSERQQIDGRIVKAFGLPGHEQEPPSCWVIDDEQGYCQSATLEGLRDDLETQAASPDVPNSFRTVFDDAACGVLFRNFEDSESQFRQFIAGSDKPGMNIAMGLMEQLRTLGIFLMPGSAQFELHAEYADATAAANAKATLVGLLALLPLIETTNASTPSSPDQALLQELRQLRIEQVENQLCIKSSMKLSQLAPGEMLSDLSSGWTSMWDSTQQQDGVLKLNGSTSVGLLPTTVQQTFHSEKYIGKRLRLKAQLSHPEGAGKLVGMALWASDSLDSPISFVSQGCTSDANLESVVALGYRGVEKPTSDATAVSEVELEIDVPDNATTLTMAAYSRFVAAELRSIELEEVGEAIQSANKAVPSFVGAYNVPHRPIGDAPRNLNLQGGDELEDSPRTATRPTEKVAK